MQTYRDIVLYSSSLQYPLIFSIFNVVSYYFYSPFLYILPSISVFIFCSCHFPLSIYIFTLLSLSLYRLSSTKISFSMSSSLFSFSISISLYTTFSHLFFYISVLLHFCVLLRPSSTTFSSFWKKKIVIFDHFISVIIETYKPRHFGNNYSLMLYNENASFKPISTSLGMLKLFLNLVD